MQPFSCFSNAIASLGPVNSVEKTNSTGLLLNVYAGGSIPSLCSFTRFEISFVTIGAQKETFGVRGKDGIYTDEFLLEETEELIKKVARKDQLELRTLIDRHITLAKNQPREQEQNALDNNEPKQGFIDYDYLTLNF